MIARLDGAEFDLVVVGGGASGLGVAVDAASRGYSVALLERADFGQGTSSRSTKLVHGGVRYLRQGRIRLVRESLRERARLLRLAPGLVRPLPFVVPHRRVLDRLVLGAGLALYDLLAGDHGLGASRRVGPHEALELAPNLRREGLRGATIYRDAQFDDARLALALARTAIDHGAVVANRVDVVGLLRGSGGRIGGARARDAESGAEIDVRGRVVVNATGVLADAVRRLDDSASDPVISPAQGAHLVVDRRFHPSESALLVPRTDDGRVLFVIPWLGACLVGTTDVARPTAEAEPRALPSEIAYLLHHAARVLAEAPGIRDVRSTFAGQRPLLRSGSAGSATHRLSREHAVLVSRGGLVTVAGGKWTTYRCLARDAVDAAASVAGLAASPCRTEDLPLHDPGGAPREEFVHAAADRSEPVVPGLACRRGDVLWAARHEMARTAEDVLARRTRALLLDPAAAAEAALPVARLVAEEIGRSEEATLADADALRRVAEGMRPGPDGPAPG